MCKVLLIDDDTLFQKMLGSLLKMEGYEVFIANNGKEGIRLFNTVKPKLVVCDIIMPEKEGTETMIELKTNFPDLKIIAISGGGRSGYVDYLQTVKEFGIDATFSKPFENQKFLDKVRELTH